MSIDKKIYILTRNCPKRHIILRNFLAYLEKVGVGFVHSPLNVSSIAKYLRVQKDLLIFADDPISFLIARLFGRKKKIVFLSLEMFEYQLPNMGLYSVLRNILFKLLHKNALKNAHFITFSNDLRRSHYVSKYPKYRIEERSMVLENRPFITPLIGDPLIFDRYRELRNFLDKFKIVAVYSGAIQAGRDLESLIQFARLQSNFGLIVIASHSNIPLSSSDSVLVFRNLVHEDVLSIVKLCDVGILNYSNNPLNVKYCAPVKVYEYLECNLKVISNKNFAMMQSGLVSAFYEDSSEAAKLIVNFESLPVIEYESKSIQLDFSTLLQRLAVK